MDPFVHIKRFTIGAPQRLRDLLWAHATFTTSGGASGNALMPVLYCESCRYPDEQVRLERVTDSFDYANKLVHG